LTPPIRRYRWLVACGGYAVFSDSPPAILIVVRPATLSVALQSRPLSKFLDRIGTVKRCPVTPSSVLPPAPDIAHIPVTFTGMPRFSAEAISLYEGCGRRFLYTHLLQVGGRRRVTAFMLMHEAIRDVYRAAIAQGAASADQCEVLLAAAFVTHGLHDHGYVDDYRAMATSMLGYFLESRAGGFVEAPTALRITFENHEVEVRPDEILVRNGVRTLRRVKTGHATSSEGKDVGAAAFVLAARAAFPDAVVELVFLADAEARPLVLSPKELTNRQVKLGGILSDIRGGKFRAEASDMTCPNCPAFFVCGALPSGTLAKAF
jgi:hypothetical protein